MATTEESSYVAKDRSAADEISRLNLQHEFLNIFANREYLHSSIPLTEVRNIADVATGSAIWFLELVEQLKHDGVDRQYTGFDMTLSQLPPSYPENMAFVEHNILAPFPARYVGAFDIVHVRLLGCALTKEQIPAAVQNIVQLIKPGGYLQWDDLDSTSLRTVPPNAVADEINDNMKKFSTLIGMDLRLPYTVQSECIALGLKEVRTVVTDSLESPEMVARTREVACRWYLDVVSTMIPVYLPVLKGLTGEEALVMRNELVEGVKGMYADGVTPGMTMVRVVARKA